MNKETETLSRLFKSLDDAKDVLGENTWREIRERLIVGSSKTQEAEFLQDLRRDDAAKSLGMTRGEYEEMLEGKG